AFASVMRTDATERPSLGLAARGVAELGERGLEAEADRPGGPVAMLRDDQLRLPLLLRIRIVAMDEHHDVGVLLEGARFTQVRELRSLVGPRLGVPVELRQREDGDL